MRSPELTRQTNRRPGFSMVESLVAMTVAATAGAALLTTIASTISTSQGLVRTNVARGMAEQMIDEIAAVGFPTSASTRPASTQSRMEFDDIEDYEDYREQPPRDRTGQLLGTEGIYWEWRSLSRLPWMQSDMAFLQRFRREVDVERVATDAGDGLRATPQDDGLRRVTVRVQYIDAKGNETPLHSITRVFAYVPFGP